MVFEDFMEEMVFEWRTRKGKKAMNREWKEIRRGWFLGGERFRSFLIERLEGVFDGRQRDSFRGEGAKAHDEGDAEKLLEMGLKALGLAEEDLENMRKGAPEKAAIAWLIRKRTVAGNRWIASKLSMGAPAYVSMLVKKVKEAKRGRLRKLRGKMGKLVL
jgi:hypothetical protein